MVAGVPVTTRIDDVVAALGDGGLAALPTETVYGLAANATDPDAIARIFATKGRPADHPLIVHLADAAHLADVAASISPAAARLAATAWPGPLTILVERSPAIPDVVSGGLATLGVRVPAHDATREVIRRLGRPIAARRPIGSVA